MAVSECHSHRSLLDSIEQILLSRLHHVVAVVAVIAVVAIIAAVAVIADAAVVTVRAVVTVIS